MNTKQFVGLMTTVIVGGIIGMILDMIFHFQGPMFYWALGCMTGTLAYAFGASK